MYPARHGFYVLFDHRFHRIWVFLFSSFLLAVERLRAIDTAMEMFLRLGSCKLEYARARKKNDISRVIG